MEAHFPFKEKLTHCFISILNWTWVDCQYVNEKNVVTGLHVVNGRKAVCISRDGDSRTTHSSVEKGTEFQHIFDEFFKLSGGKVDKLDIHCKLEGDPPVKPYVELINRVSKVLAGRPIKVKLLRQSSKSSDDLNSPLNQFFRDYIDFSMYGTMYDVEPSYSPLVISEKMLKCEFLYFNTFLANSEVLNDFKGWGLVIRKTDPRFKFDLLKEVFQKWYSGEDIQWKYLCFPCEVSLDECEFIKPLGKVFNKQRREKSVTDYEITRTNGEICHLGGLPFAEEIQEGDETPHLMYFYTGDCTEQIFFFNYWNCSW